jgi:ferric-dicitrate binding protein FerR (iron transport regulator)
MNENLESLLREVGRSVRSSARDQRLLPQVQARLATLDVASARRSALRRWTLAGALAAGAAACAVVGVVAGAPRWRALSYAVTGATAEAGRVGLPLAAPPARSIHLDFSDGSGIALAPRARAHVDALDARGATVAIDEGTLEVRVVHRARTRWRLRAGGYQIQVTGTRFAAAWDGPTQALTVTMHEGSVAVSGPGLEEPVRIVTGQRLRATPAGIDLRPQAPAAVAGEESGVEPAAAAAPDLAAAARAPAPMPALMPAPMPAPTPAPMTASAPARGQPSAAPEPPQDLPAAPVSLRPATGAPAPAPAEDVTERRASRMAPPRPATAAPAPARDEPGAAPVHMRRSPAAPARPVVVAVSAADWRSEAAHARYRDALGAAVQEGWRAECARLGADDVILLGDIARFAGDLPRAEEAYRIARRRFPEAADRPTYALGLLAFEGRHEYRAAAGLFASYLRSFPHGPLAREAAGRLLESRLKTGDAAASRQAALDYLRAVPAGPHVGLARNTVGP